MKRSAESAGLEQNQQMQPDVKRRRLTQANNGKNRFESKRAPPPSNYICHKCRNRGHWINDCTQNNNHNNNNNNHNTNHKMPPNYTCHKCSKKGHWKKDCPLNIASLNIASNNNNNNANNNSKSESAIRPIPPANYICHRCGLYGHLIEKCPTNNKQNLTNKPKWHPFYMNILLFGDLTKISKCGGIIKRDKNYKCNPNEDDRVIFYFNHCSKIFVDQCKTKQFPSFVKFKIGFPRRSNLVLLAFDVEFAVLSNKNNEEKEKDKLCGEIMTLSNCDKNRNGWIYCKNNNLMYCFNGNTHNNIGNVVVFNEFIKMRNDNIGKQLWAKNIIITQKYDETVWKSLYNEENQCIYNNKHKLFIRDCKINLREDRHTEFKQFYHLNNRCHIFKICETMLKYLNAFVNTDGGSIYFGINDDAVIKGIQYVDNETMDNISKYIDNRLREWIPNNYNQWKQNIEFIDVIERNKTDNYCYKIPQLQVIKASIKAIKLKNNTFFKNHDNQSWTKNIASISKITKNSHNYTHKK